MRMYLIQLTVFRFPKENQRTCYSTSFMIALELLLRVSVNGTEKTAKLPVITQNYPRTRGLMVYLDHISMRVAILGSGCIGGYVGGCLATVFEKRGEQKAVIFVGRERFFNEIKEQGQLIVSDLSGRKEVSCTVLHRNTLYHVFLVYSNGL